MAEPGEVPPVIGQEGKPKANQAKKAPAKKSKHKIGNLEWGLVLTATIICDAVQIVLDFFVIGAIINRFIDIAVGMILPIYFYLRGVKMTSKKIWSMIGAFVGEFIPVVDALPLWSLDVALIMAWEKAEEKAEGTGLGKVMEVAANRDLKRESAPQGAVPPRIGASGRPMAETGQTPPVIEKSEEQQRGTPEMEENASQIRAKISPQDGGGSTPPPIPRNPSPTAEKPSNNVVDLRNNPQHERVEGSRGKYKESV
ncbi:MAG: hypothetical protein ABI430_03430 [Candidatus Taylorbacteria bacterium]